MISSIFFLLMAIIFIALFLHFVPLRLWQKRVLGDLLFCYGSGTYGP